MAKTHKKVQLKRKRQNKGAAPQRGLMLRPYDGQTVVVERKYIGTITKAASDAGIYRTFALSAFPDADIVSMFSEYKIEMLTLSYMLVNAPNNNASFPTLYVAPQNISSTTPASRDEVVQYKGARVFQFGPATNMVTYSFKPEVAIDAATTGKRFVVSPWLSTATDAIPHYTNVEWISRYNSTSDPTHTIELCVSAVVSCRGTR
jgi:hypothetical protein